VPLLRPGHHPSPPTRPPTQQDVNGRGIGAFRQPSGELRAAAAGLLSPSVRSVVVLTGFPCMIQHTPPTETDGPPGAVAIARALTALGKKVVIATDECNAEVMMAAVAGCGISGALLRLEAFASTNEWDGDEESRLLDLAEECDTAVAVERAGPGADGGYYTMRGFDMRHLVAPLERLLDLCGGATVGIGDGGNEVGMGKSRDAILASQAVPHADKIACVTASDRLVVAAVSNWGGYALAAALAVLAADRGAAVAGARRGSRAQALAAMLPSAAGETALIERIVAAGARDGVTGKLELGVDGLPASRSIDFIGELRGCCE